MPPKHTRSTGALSTALIRLSGSISVAVTPSSARTSFDSGMLFCERGKAPPQFRIRLTSGVPHLSHLIWTLVFLLGPPLLLILSRLSWEGRRWAESDFTSAGGERTDSDSGSDSDD